MTIAESIEPLRSIVEAAGHDPMASFPSGSSAAQVASVEAELGFDLPSELRQLYSVTDGTIVVESEAGHLSTFAPQSMAAIAQVRDWGFCQLASLPAMCRWVEQYRVFSEDLAEAAGLGNDERSAKEEFRRGLRFLPVCDDGEGRVLLGLEPGLSVVRRYWVENGFQAGADAFPSVAVMLERLVAMHHAEEVSLQPGGVWGYWFEPTTAGDLIFYEGTG